MIYHCNFGDLTMQFLCIYFKDSFTGVASKNTRSSRSDECMVMQRCWSLGINRNTPHLHKCFCIVFSTIRCWLPSCPHFKRKPSKQTIKGECLQIQIGYGMNVTQEGLRCRLPTYGRCCKKDEKYRDGIFFKRLS